MNNILERDFLNPGKSSIEQRYELPYTIKIPQTASSAKIPSQLCRVCLQQGHKPILNQNNCFDFPLSHYLKLICNIDITANDHCPQYICRSCSDTLDSAIKLRKMAMKSQLQLKIINLNCLNMFIKETAQTKRKFDLIILPPLQKTDTKQKFKDIALMEDNNAPTPRKKEETDEELEDVDQIGYNNVPITSPLHEDIDLLKHSDIPNASQFQNKQNNNTNKLEHNSEVPILTLEQAKKFKSKQVPYNTYYERYLTADKKFKYQCRICKKEYKKGSTSDHLFTHLPESASQYVCEVCGKRFKTFSASYTHRVIHKKTVPFECKLCPYKGRSKVLLRIHIKRVHKKEYNYHCKLCPRKFLDASNLQYHVRRHGDPKFPCTTCHRSFYENSSLKKHVQLAHVDIEPQKCDICGNLYKHRGNLLSHQIKVHKRKQVYNNRATYLKLESGIKVVK